MLQVDFQGFYGIWNAKAYLCGWVSIFEWNIAYIKKIVSHLPDNQTEIQVLNGVCAYQNVFHMPNIQPEFCALYQMVCKKRDEFQVPQVGFRDFLGFTITKRIYVAGFKFLVFEWNLQRFHIVVRIVFMNWYIKKEMIFNCRG